MTFFKLCKNDPLLSVLRDTFQANPIMIPEERIQPLIILSAKGKNLQFIGQIERLLIDGPSLLIDYKKSQMASVSTTKSKNINTELGLKVMEGFLNGLGSTASSIKHIFDGSTEVSFSFKNVKRKYIELADLTSALTDRRFKIENSIIKAFIEGRSKCAIITDIITSNNFSIKIEKTISKDFKFNVTEINNLLSSNDNKIEVSAKTNQEITFTGKKALSFAFKAAILGIEEDGLIYFDTRETRSVLTKTFEQEEEEIEIYISDGPGLININF